MTHRHPNLTYEHLVEALESTRGFILAAKKYIEKTWGYSVGYSTIKSRIIEWGMEDWLDDIRKSLVEDCLARTFHNGIKNGDNTCLSWVLKTYGHHVDFLGGIDTETESKKGWRELLEYVKGNTKSNTEEKP